MRPVVLVLRPGLGWEGHRHPMKLNSATAPLASSTAWATTLSDLDIWTLAETAVHHKFISTT